MPATLLAKVQRLRRVRWVVRGIGLLGIAASIAANVLHADPNPISQAIAAWPPIAFVLTVELIHRVPVTTLLTALARMVATSVIAGIAAWVSYWHMAGVAARYGETGASAYLLPFSVDGLIVVASIGLVELGRALARATAQAEAYTEQTLRRAAEGSHPRHGEVEGVPTVPHIADPAPRATPPAPPAEPEPTGVPDSEPAPADEPEDAEPGNAEPEDAGTVVVDGVRYVKRSPEMRTAAEKWAAIQLTQGASVTGRMVADRYAQQKRWGELRLAGAKRARTAMRRQAVARRSDDVHAGV